MDKMNIISSQAVLEFFDTMDLSLVETTLHDSPDLVIHRTEI